MIDTEEKLRERNEIAASLGQDIVIKELKKFRERFVSQMKTATPGQGDPFGINLHRYLGRIEAVDFLISEAERAAKPQSNNKKG